MKRFSAKEMALVTAPLGVVALMVWGAHKKEEIWPTKPHITECFVRPATPLEVSQGAEIGISTRAVLPINRGNRYDSGLMDFALKPSATQKSANGRVYAEKNNWGRLHYQRIVPSVENEDGIKWTDFADWAQPLEAEVTLKSASESFGTLKKTFELRTDGIEKADPLASRNANFQVTKATMCFKGADKKQTVVLTIDYFDDPLKFTSEPQCIGDWTLKTEKTSFPLWAKQTQWCNLNRSSYQIWIGLEKATPWPDKAIEIRGALSF